MDIPIHVYKVFTIFGVEVWLTETVVNTWILMAAIILLAVIARIKLTTFKEKPSGFQNVIEIIIESMDNFVKGTMGERYAYFGNWFFGVFVFILVSNLSGLLGFRAPTADLATTAALGFATFFLIHFMGIFTQKGQYFKSYIEPVAVMLPMNIISEIATPISLSFRLFGNILGGSIIMGLVYSIPFWLPLFFLKLGIPGVLHIYFDVFAGCIQTVIFVMLSMTFIKDKIAD
jgi:F-type H+-transporting ATPase subunit a